MLKKLFDSKKAVVAVIGLVLEVIVAANILVLDEASKAMFMENVVIIVGAYVVGQGIADHGKEKAKIDKGVTS